MKLSTPDFDQWVEAHVARDLREDGGMARVSAVDRGSFLIRNEFGEVPAEITGRFSYRVESPVDLSCVGDWMQAQYYDNGANGRYPRGFPAQDLPAAQTPGRQRRFPDDCSNAHELGCTDRYAGYIKLKKESDYYGMSYRDKRKKDKAFGRFMKSYKKQIKGKNSPERFFNFHLKPFNEVGFIKLVFFSASFLSRS